MSAIVSAALILSSSIHYRCTIASDAAETARRGIPEQFTAVDTEILNKS